MKPIAELKRVSQLRAWTALGSLLVSVGCNASIGRNDLPTSGATKTQPGAAGSSSTGGGPSTATLGRDAVAQRCDTTQLAPPQLRRLTGVELERTLRDVFPMLGGAWAGARLGADPVSPLGFSNDARTLVVASPDRARAARPRPTTSPNTAHDGRRAGTDGARGVRRGCVTAARACADTLVQAVGARLFRRAVSADEASDYGALYDSVAAKSDFTTGAHWVLVALIQSPSAVYRSELGTVDQGGRKLSPDELGTELSYTFGGTVPSADLLAAAERGDFATPEARVAKAKELLATPTGLEQLHQFLAEWSGYGKVASKTKTTVANFEALRGSMQQETKLFFDEAVVNRKGGMRELLTANYTFVDSSLSALYGFGAATGSDFALTQRPAGQGLGLLAQGSILAGSAHADASSPTLRGLVVYRASLVSSEAAGATQRRSHRRRDARSQDDARALRDRASQLAGTCATCHQFFDPLGFGFEHFDEAGRYRADEGGLTIDSTGQALAYPATNAVFSFDGEDDLAQKLRARSPGSGRLRERLGCGLCVRRRRRPDLPGRGCTGGVPRAATWARARLFHRAFGLAEASSSARAVTCAVEQAALEQAPPRPVVKGQGASMPAVSVLIPGVQCRGDARGGAR